MSTQQPPPHPHHPFPPEKTPPRRKKARSPHHNAYAMLPEQETISLPYPLPRMKPTTLALLVYLIGQRVRARKNLFTLHSSIVEDETGLSRETLRKARKELVGLKLITATDKLSEKGKWEFGICDPSTGVPLTQRVQLKFSDLSDAAVLEFYRRLDLDIQNTIMDCPACRRAGEATITLDRGNDEEHGFWSCGKCDNGNGGFIHALMHVRAIPWDIAVQQTAIQLQDIQQQQLPKF